MRRSARYTGCDAIRVELSARLDDETTPATDRMLDQHLAACRDCRAFEESLHALRRSLRLQSLDDVPDLTAQIRERIAVERTTPRRSEVFGHLRAAGLAAAATVLLFIGSSFPGLGPPRDTASADEIARGIQAAARSLVAYSATFEVVERNFSTDLRTRRFTADVRFEAPEKLALRVEDRTERSGSHRPQSYSLVASPRRWAAIEPSECVPQPVRPCPAAGSPVRSGLVRRQPFDQTALVPTDLILPLESVASAGELVVLGEGRVMDRAAQGVEVSGAAAGPLLRALDPFGVWRPVHPLDRVQIWLDRSTWFPLSFEVIATESAERAAWAARLGLPDAPGASVLRAVATSLTEDAGAGAFSPPMPRAAFDGGFDESRFAPVRSGPAFVAGLEPYRAGRTASGDRVAAYVKGISWLRVSAGEPQAPSIGALLQSDELRLASGFAYYAPASGTGGRRVDVYGAGAHVRIESNLPRATLIEVAESVPVRGERQARARSAAALTRRVSPATIRDRYRYAAFPRDLPPGYDLTGTFVTSQRGQRETVSLYYRRAEAESDPVGIRVTQSRAFDTLPPTSEDPVVVAVGNELGRWSIERGELEWIEDGVYRAVTVPALDLQLALRIAHSL